MANLDCEEQIKQLNKIIKAFRTKKELFDKEKDILDIEEQRYRLFYSQIHEFLAPKHTESAEKKIRECVKDIFTLDLPVCEAKIQKMQSLLEEYEKKRDEKNTRLCYQYLQKWLTLYENNYALVAFRSLEHFALFMEWDKPDKDKFWKYSIDTFNDNGYSGCTKGFFYYANQMVLDNKIKFILKQMPTSFGKSFSDSVMIAFIFGVNKSEQVVKVVGNRSLPAKCCRQVVDIMCTTRYLKVFPEYSIDVDLEKELSSQIFSTCSIKDGLLTIRGSGRDTNYESFSKETKRDGIRCGFLFLDDIVQRKETMNLKQHEEDIADFTGTWKRRARDENLMRIVCGGTTYDPYDILMTLKFRYSKGKVKKSPVNKYTTLSLDEDAAFICVPKLDEKDQLTFPQKTVLQNVLEDRKNDPKQFAAMDMQQPLSPEENPFYWEYIRTYDFVPKTDENEICIAALDPARTGDNYVSMPIFKKVTEFDDDFQTQIDRYYLVDCIYLKAPMDSIYDLICEQVEKHNIVRLHIEKNTDTSLKYLLQKKFLERNIISCEITEVFSTAKKETRIYSDENIIKTRIVFPARGLYSRVSQIGLFMEHIVAYKYSKSEYDDSIDSVSLFIDRFIKEKNKAPKAKLLYV